MGIGLGACVVETGSLRMKAEVIGALRFGSLRMKAEAVGALHLGLRILVLGETMSCWEVGPY